MRPVKTIKILLVLIIIVAVLGLIFYFVWPFFRSSKVNNDSIAISAASIQNKANQFKELKLGVFLSLNELDQYGQWPLVAVPLSESRGNPFEAKK